jgi:NADH dehydrogenase FAD-containing subunit
VFVFGSICFFLDKFKKKKGRKFKKMGNGQAQPKSSKTVIVVGGGYVGSDVAKKLDPYFQVTLIESQDALHHKIASLRSAVVPGWEKRARIPLDRMMKFGKVIQAEVANVTPGVVTLKDGKKLSADFIVLAHGNGSTLFPAGPKRGVLDSKTATADLKEAQGQFANARSILIVGGGPVGVELAGELKAQYPDKTIHLVHSHDALLSNSTPPINPVATAKLLELLNRVGIDVKLNSRVVNLPDSGSNNNGFIVGNRTYNLSDGTTINADLAVLAYGVPHTGSNIVTAVDSSNRVLVNQFLQVEGMQNVFCVGDANNHRETKMAYTGSVQGAHVAKNIGLIATGRAPLPYVGIEGKNAQYGAMFVPVGPRKGVGAMDKQVFTSFMLRNVKGKGLFSKKQFGDKNVPLPPV